MIRGRGWPAIDGWDLDDRFLSEEEFSAEIDAAGVVLIPYQRFYQSGVAIRALEGGVPVVGPQHPFLSNLFGDDTLVDRRAATERWVEAIVAAMSSRANGSCGAAHGTYFAAAVAEWKSALDG